MMHLVTWTIGGARNAMLVEGDESGRQHALDIAGFDGVSGVGWQSFDAIDISRVAVLNEHHDRLMAARDAQIAALETINLALRQRPRVFSCALVTNEHDEVLLIHNRNRGGWELPGGHIERDEHPRDAAVREVEEEAGIKASLNASPCDALSGPTGVSFVYRGRAEGEPAPGDDADMAAWFTRWEVRSARSLSDIPSARLVREWAAQAPPRPVYLVCPGEPKPCIGSGVSTKERACPNCGQWCVPYPSTANLEAAARPRIDDPIVRKRGQNAAE